MSKFKDIKNYFIHKNIIVILCLIVISIPILIGTILGTYHKWFDILSIVSVFYIGIFSIVLISIFWKNPDGAHQGILSIFKFKEMKKIKSERLSESEIDKLKIFNISNKISKPEKYYSKNDIIFISVSLIIYGLILLLCSIPSLIIFTMK